MLTHVEWPSRFGRNAGRSGTIASRSSRRGVPSRKSAMYQPLPTIHGVVRVGRDVGPDRREHAVPAARVADVALEPVDAAGDRVDVGVLEARQEQPAGEVDDPRVAARRAAATSAADADGDDPLAADGDGLGARPGRVDGVDVAAGQDEVGGAVGMRHRPRMTARPAATGDGPDRGTSRRRRDGRRRLSSRP